MSKSALSYFSAGVITGVINYILLVRTVIRYPTHYITFVLHPKMTAPYAFIGPINIEDLSPH